MGVATHFSRSIPIPFSPSSKLHATHPPIHHRGHSPLRHHCLQTTLIHLSPSTPHPININHRRLLPSSHHKPKTPWTIPATHASHPSSNRSPSMTGRSIAGRARRRWRWLRHPSSPSESLLEEGCQSWYGNVFEIGWRRRQGGVKSGVVKQEAFSAHLSSGGIWSKCGSTVRKKRHL